ncbi:MAG: terminase small subunit [Methylocystis sp.]|uniref:terminase small subunit n=1 Tax=Methylocystis sp. TaxID=1911079 RepID=UPI003DA67F8E
MTPKQTRFAMTLFECGDQTEAYRRTYNVENMSQNSIYTAAYELANHPEVVKLIEERTEDAALVATLNEAWVLKRYMMLANADPNELVESRLVCCRHCHGIDHNYQWVDAREWAEAVAAVLDDNARRAGSRNFTPRAIPTNDGGYGFWGTKPPAHDCPKCFGRGLTDIHIHDTRNLSPAGKLLYAGVKMTANGPEIKMRDQDGALDFLAKYLGLDKKVLDINPPPGSTSNLHKLSEITNDPIQASKAYANLLTGT